jgi:hypothetical protein
VILCGMPKATDAQKMRLAEATLRLAREALRGVRTDLEAGADYGEALFECPDSYEDVTRLVAKLCPADEWPEIEGVLGSGRRLRRAFAPDYLRSRFHD